MLDNLDLQLQYRWLQFPRAPAPLVLALNAGLAWNTDMPAYVERGAASRDNLQYYLQVVINTLVEERLGLGLVPSYLHNSSIFSVDRQYTITLGTYVHYYFDRMWGVWVEYSPTLAGVPGNYPAPTGTLPQLPGLGPVAGYRGPYLLRFRHQQYPSEPRPVPGWSSGRRRPGKLAPGLRDYPLSVSSRRGRSQGTPG